MKIDNLTLKNFRNYESETFVFTDGINVLSGSNAQGKTNCVEAIFFLCTGYSPRANRDKLVIRDGADGAEITGYAVSDYGKVEVKLFFDRSERKKITVNGAPISRIGELMGNIRSVFFSPGELKLVRESPEDRRRFLNISLSQLSKSYFYALSKYNKILEQRNRLLKNEDFRVIRETLPVWDEQLAKEGAKIIFSRNAFVKELLPYAEQKHAALSDGKEVLNVSPDCGFTGEEGEIRAKLYAALEESRDKDVRLGFTNVGPHRDDLKITLGKTDIRQYGSQGQQRTAALALKLAETEIFKDRMGEYPVLLLDDVFSELDRKRRKKLIGAVKGLQTIITVTEIERQLFRNSAYRKLTVENGKVKETRDFNE